jgi:hypothetical protein
VSNFTNPNQTLDTFTTPAGTVLQAFEHTIDEGDVCKDCVFHGDAVFDDLTCGDAPNCSFPFRDDNRDIVWIATTP